MTLSQSTFADALLAPSATAPTGLSDGRGRAAGRRFDVYRNNVIVSLTEALEKAFPVLTKLVGTDNFKLLARTYVAAHPPSSPLMMFYGMEMPAFLETFEPARAIGYLPDIARLEIALRESYHAADALPVDPSSLEGLAPERLLTLRPNLAPSLRLVRSRWPIHAIWRFNKVAGAPKPTMAAEDVLVLRPALDPEPQLLPPGGAAFIAALLRHATLAEAFQDAVAEAADFELTQTLTLLIGGGAILDIGETA
ncbi:MAG: DNA-binding domain-containing protein [Pseudomonadota bacterium]